MSKKSKKLKSNKKRIRRRHILSIAALVLLMSMGIVALLALGQATLDAPTQLQAQTIPVNFYFRDEDGHWGSELREIEVDDDDAIIRAVLVGLLEGPRTAGFLPSIPEGVYIQGARLRTAVDNTLRITFSPSFNYIDPIEIIDARSSLVYTMTELDFVNQLEFFVGEYPMLDGDGEEFGFRSRENTALEDAIASVDIHTATVVLYFADEQMLALVPEERTITINPLEDIARFILDALLEGPQTPGLYAAIPEGTTYNMVERTVDTIFVGFTQDFYDSLSAGGSLLEEMMVFSLVNTLTEQPDIRRVQIFIDEAPIQPDEYGNLHIDLSRPIDRDESLIQSNE
ncbi:MAG: GerMN domain-containing protein [Clostridiales bacterium]|jgi:germination protein M|nr:GerMN domain-containing protein [Clostridiales bacterium]